MKKSIFLLITLLISCFLLDGPVVYAEETVEIQMETFCRYKYSAEKGGGLFGTEFLSNVLAEGLGGGKYNNTLVDIVDNNGQLEVKTPSSSDLYIAFKHTLNQSNFYINGEFTCPKEINASKLANVDAKGRMELVLGESDGKYIFKLQGNKPAVRELNPNDVIIKEATCTGLLGPMKDDLEGALKVMRFIAPVFVIVLGAYDYMAAIFSKDAELLKKANGRLIKRLSLIAVLFFLPIILNLILGIIDESYMSCIT